MRRYGFILILLLTLIASAAFATEPIAARAGKYSVNLTSQPSPPGVGENLLVITLKEGDKPVIGAGVDVHIDMTSMPMPADSKATPGANPGEYGAMVNFAMAGEWNVEVAVQQMAGMPMEGDGTARFLVETGKGIMTAGGGVRIPWFGLFAALVILAVVLAILFRKRLPQRTQSLVAGILTLLVVLVGTITVVKKFRDPKTATVLGSASMNMETSSAAPGTVAVTAETVLMEPFQSAASYTGTVVPDVEEDVYPRVTGRLVFMPFYPGDRIAPGQVVAKLDSSELSAKELQAAYGSQGAAQNIDAASIDITAARAGLARAERGVEGAQAQLAQALSAARSADGGVYAARADIDQARQGIIEAEGDVESAEADVAYWDAEIARAKKLYDVGAISREELDRETAQAATARAKLKQAKAVVKTAQAGVTGAQARLSQAQADRDSANGRVAEARAAVQAAQADVQAAEASVQGATVKAGVAGTEARRAQAELTEASTVRGYTTIRAANGGVVTARNLVPGTLVQPGMSILKIAKLDVVRLQVSVSEADLAQVRVGQTLTAWTMDNPDQPIIARISAVFPAQENTTRTAIVEARVNNPGMRLMGGQYLNVSLNLGDSQRAALSVPNSAVIARDGQKSVFMVAQDGMRAVARRVQVVTGRINNQRMEILSGLNAGDAIIVAGQDNLREGDAVTVLRRSGSVSMPPSDMRGAAALAPTAFNSGTERGVPPPATAMPAAPNPHAQH